MLRKYLKERKSFLQKTIKQCRQWLDKAPNGRLRISCSRGSVSFYRAGERYKKEVRLSKDKDYSLILRLAKKDYYQKLIPVAEKELESVDNLLCLKEKQTLANVIASFHPERRKLISSIEETRENALNKWIDIPTPITEPRKGSYYIPTERGEYVRSKNEYLIANALFHAGIPYKYEFPYTAVNDVILHPDFYVKNINTGQEFFWEHFGMMDNPDYVVKSFMYKISLYQAGGIILGKNLIATFSGGKNELDIGTITAMIDAYLT
jgi:hypothetical protein